jgi:hypothetical protein
MKSLFLTLLLSSSFILFAQSDSIQSKVLLIPFAPFMYFSDADNHIAQGSKLSENDLREKIRNGLEANVYHQLLSRFDAISLMRATTISGEDGLRKIYGATRYIKYNSKSYVREVSSEEQALKEFTSQLYKKTKGQIFFAQDTNVMVAVFDDDQLFKDLSSKYNEKYILFITQFEVNTSNKNQLEWQYREYSREYSLHYNIFNAAGKLIRAEVLIIKAGGENNLKDIETKYISQFAEKLKLIMSSLNN